MTTANPNTAELLTPTLADLLSPQDPKKKLLLAQALQGTDTSPVQHWTQGLARMANSAIGNYGLYQDDQEAKGRENKIAAALAADPLMGGSGAPAAAPAATGGNSVPKLLAALFGGGQPSAPPAPASAVPMGGIIGQPLPQLSGGTGEPSPPPPPMVPGRPSPLPPASLGPGAPGQAVALPDTSASATARPEIAPSARVWGDKEAEAAGLYGPAPSAAGALPNARVADAFSAAYGRPPVAPGPASPPGIVAAPPPPAAVPPVAASGAAPAPEVAPRRMPTIPPERAAYVKQLLADPATRALGMQLRAQYEKPEEDAALRQIEDMRTNPAKYGFKGPNDPELIAALRQRASGVNQMTTVNTSADPFLKGIGEDVLAQRNAARVSAESTIPAIHEARKALDSGAITGAFAGGRLGLAKIGNLFGINDPKAVESTETLRSAIGTTVLAHAKTLGANPSNADRDYIEKVMGGNIELNEGSMRKILDIQEKWSRNSITNSNKMAQKLIDGNPAAYRHVAPAAIIDMPPEYTAPPPAGFKVLGVR